jgi:hypothetical protein
MTVARHDRLHCPLCDSELSRDTVRPPCANSCTHPNGEPRLAELAGPRSGRPVCAHCALREHAGVPWSGEEREQWAEAAVRDGAREVGGGW